jgi:hypothetical protein
MAAVWSGSFSPAPGEGEVILGSQLLAADGDDGMVDEGLADGREIGLAPHVGSDDLGPETAGQGLDEYFRIWGHD